MTDMDYCDITIVADRSGSMGGYADGEFTKAQRSTMGVTSLVDEHRKAPGRVRFSLIEFDTSYDWVAQGAESLTWHCLPRGGTALLDAVGRAITETGERLEKMPEHERPGKVIFVIATDGEENSSREYSRDQVAKMITHQKDAYGWDFAFIGADIDAFGEAGGIGIAQGSVLSSTADSYATAWAMSSNATLRSRATGQSLSYTDEERQQVRDAE